MVTRRSALAAGFAALAVAGGVAAAGTASADTVKPKAAAATAVAYVKAHLGAPYQYGGVGPNVFDAPGLVVAAYAAGGVTLPHNTGALAARATRVSTPQPGDLVFYGTGSPSTVAVAIGNNQVIGAFTPGTTVTVKQINFQTVFTYGRIA